MYAHGMQDPISPESSANLLASSASSYLRSAAHQPVRWHPWGEEAFRLARVEDKPVLLDSGAVWCHWCHVMDRESYEDAEIAAIINQYFIAVKVDRDERPDVDARYQAAVQAINGRGGWPLTAFLTPDGRPYYGATYIPRYDLPQSPGMARVLLSMAQVWRERRAEALEAASEVMTAIDFSSGHSAGFGGELRLELAGRIADAAKKKFDVRNGGFGTEPKFAHPAAIDLLLTEAAEGDDEAGRVSTITLEKMARGGVYDQIGGGFHRYSVDAEWHVPHFEKMLYDNTELIRNYVHGWQTLGREEFREVALDIVGWLDETMSDRERGGFFASQDADISLDDDGDYFTWTVGEAREALRAGGRGPARFSEAEIALILVYWQIGEQGEMRHDPARNVLRRERTADELAVAAGRDADELRGLIGRSREALRAARGKRTAPFIDRTLYTGWNAMAVSAYLDAAAALGLGEARAFALKTLDRLLDTAYVEQADGTAALSRVMAYGGAETPPAEPVAGTLEDFSFTLHACLDGYEASGEMRYYRAAERLARTLLERFEDRDGGGFFDTAATEGEKLGALAARRKPFEDTPTPGGNSMAAAGLARLAGLGGGEPFRAAAKRALAAFAGVAEQFGLAAASYGLAVKRLLLDPEQVVVVGAGAEAEKLATAAQGLYAVNREVVRLRPEQLSAELPPALAETVAQAPTPGGAWALVCRGHRCLPPVSAAEALREALRG